MELFLSWLSGLLIEIIIWFCRFILVFGGFYFLLKYIESVKSEKLNKVVIWIFGIFAVFGAIAFNN